MVQTTTRAALLKAFEEGVIDTPQGAFIGSFSLATVQLLLSCLDSGVVSVSRQAEVETQYILAEPDAMPPETWSHLLPQVQKGSALPYVMEWRIPDFPSFYTFASAARCGTLQRPPELPTLAVRVTGYRHCDPTQIRIWNGVVYRRRYRGWQPGRDLNHAGNLDSILILASALGIEVECSLGWTLSRWLHARLDHPMETGRTRAHKSHTPSSNIAA